MAGALVDPASPLDLIQCLTVGIFPREGRTGHSLGRHRSGAVGFGLLFLSRLPLVLGLVQMPNITTADLMAARRSPDR